MVHKNTIIYLRKTATQLTKHLLSFQQEAEAMMDLLVSQMAKEQVITEELKATDQMKWLGLMNNIRHSAEKNSLK